MNTPTETLAERLAFAKNYLPHFSTARDAVTESASRLLAQHETLMKQDERIADLEKELEESRSLHDFDLNSLRTWKAKADRYWQELEQERQDRKQSDIDAIRALGERNDARNELAEAKADAEAWKREAMIANARLRGESHPDDNGIVSPDEITPRLQAELAAERKNYDAAFEALKVHGKNYLAERALADRLARELSCLADWREAYEADCHYNPEPLAAWKEARRE